MTVRKENTISDEKLSRLKSTKIKSSASKFMDIKVTVRNLYAYVFTFRHLFDD